MIPVRPDPLMQHIYRDGWIMALQDVFRESGWWRLVGDDLRGWNV
jgi:hypothetical protein